MVSKCHPICITVLLLIPGHPSVILHIDIDCFYAQVEMIRNPVLRNKPLGRLLGYCGCSLSHLLLRKN